MKIRKLPIRAAILSSYKNLYSNQGKVLILDSKAQNYLVVPFVTLLMV
jgi:hypothetical protein